MKCPPIQQIRAGAVGVLCLALLPGGSTTSAPDKTSTPRPTHTAAPTDTPAPASTNSFAFSNNVSVIETQTLTVTAWVPTGLSPIGAAVNPNGSFAYIVNAGTNDVTVIDTQTNTVPATVAVGPCPLGVAVRPDGSF